MKSKIFCFLIFSPFFLAAPRVVQKIQTKALYSYFEQKTGELILKGAAQIHRDDISLYADKIFYHESKKEAFASGSVRLEMGKLTLFAGQLRVYMKGSKAFSYLKEDDAVVIAQKHPRLVEKNEETDQENEITAVEIKFYKSSEKIEAFENVRLIQGGGAFEGDTRITGEYMEYLHLQGKALIKNKVKIESPKMGGHGDRLIYYRQDEKFYLIGNALIYELGENGQKLNEVSSQKILHLVKERRTIQMGDVEGIIRVGP
jgi:lipopolysaccharide assembly outer membrane protein LptD (OstA)